MITENMDVDIVPSTTAPEKPRKRKKKDAGRGPNMSRGPGVALKQITDKKLKGKLKHSEKIFREAVQKAKKINEYLLPDDAGYLESEGLERTWNFQQQDLVQQVDVGAARKAFDLQLTELGPYNLSFTRSGRHLALAGSKGHLAVMEWQTQHLVCEVQVRETIRDVTFLHNELFFAAAQKKYVYIYDKRGVEVHCLKHHTEPQRLEFLPHHFLLASVGGSGVLHYQDTSTGQVVATHRSKLGPCNAMKQNPSNAVLCLGHANGSVTMWTPNITSPVVKMLCHRGPVRGMAVDVMGRHLVTAGLDGQVKVWDIRMLQPLHAYFADSPATDLEISQRGLLAVSQGRRVQVWRDALSTKAKAPYMTHTLTGGAIEDLHFCPYEDVLAMGHAGGISTMLVPGAGEPNFDSFVANPFQTVKQRREQEVVQLLDKLQPDSIVLDPDSIAKVRAEPAAVQKERHEAERAANQARRKQQEDKNDSKSKMKGKNRPSKRHRKKQGNIIEERGPEVKQRIREKEAQEHKEAAEKAQAELEQVPRALHRFYKK